MTIQKVGRKRCCFPWVWCFLGFFWPLRAQEPRPSFEVASVKLNSRCQEGERNVRPSPGRLSLSCVPLRILVRMAYSGFAGGSNVPKRIEVTGGPGWVDSDRFDIEAKASDAVAPNQIYGPMLQVLLEERFRLAVRRESKQDSVYELTVAKIGAKLKSAKDGDCVMVDLNHLPARPEPGQPQPHYCGMPSGRSNAAGMVYDGYGMTMAEFASRMLANYVDRPVIDRTGLAGKFDIHLEFVPNLAMMHSPVRLNGVDASEVPPPPEEAGKSIFGAVEKLGLKLSPGTGPQEFLVITHVERLSGN
jgi:uncharacterized protein (TIGR03435 family)